MSLRFTVKKAHREPVRDLEPSQIRFVRGHDHALYVRLARGPADPFDDILGEDLMTINFSDTTDLEALISLLKSVKQSFEQVTDTYEICAERRKGSDIQ